jgi:putative transposase
VPTRAGFLYLAIVLDASDRCVIELAMKPHLRTQFVLAALDIALAQRPPIDIIQHSGQGRHCTAVAFGKRCREAGVRPSMSFPRLANTVPASDAVHMESDHLLSAA